MWLQHFNPPRLLTLFLAFLCYASAQGTVHLLGHDSKNHQLAGDGIAPVIYVSNDDYKSVRRAAEDVALDFGRAIGVNGSVEVLSSTSKYDQFEKPTIIAGSLDNSSLIRSLVEAERLDVNQIQGEWESYVSQVVKDPVDGLDWALIVAGSDMRGTIYGLYDISSQLGVSPWHWWADSPTTRVDTVSVGLKRKVQGSPSVKYRGIFINDEAPALTNWAKETFGFSANPFRQDFYKLVFELCLRLRANYIWPAMWGSAFYVDDEDNGQLADDFGIIIGTSHHEPMARADREQKTDLDGEWDWGKNKNNITQFFKDGVERAKDWDTIWTMGMRGSGDAESPTLTPHALEEIIGVQQDLLLDILDAETTSQIPQTWVLYKEVGRYYQAGMEVPDEVTLLWTDDNWGNLLRTPLANETSRSGGAGVYYHFDYVGTVRSYKWISTIQLVKTWEQMHLAFEHHAREIWIVNVGDIKPMEVPITHFLDMAYDMSQFSSPESTQTWIQTWAAQEFGYNVADDIAKALTVYGKLVSARKYELLSDLPYAYSVANYDEIERVSGEWEDLLDFAQAISDRVAPEAQSSFYQMVLFQIIAGKTVVDLYNTVVLNSWYAHQHRVSANHLAGEAGHLFQRDTRIAEEYHSIKDGKWNHTASQPHIGYTNWQQPDENIMPNVSWVGDGHSTGLMGVGIQGREDAASEGDDLRLLPDEDKIINLVLPISNSRVESQFKGHVEFNGVVSMEAEHFEAKETKDDLEYIIIPDYGQTLSGVKLWPATATSQTPESAPKLTYSLYTFTSAKQGKLVAYFGGTLNHDPSRPLKFAFSIDGGEITTTQPVPEAPMGSTPRGWSAAVTRNGWVSSHDVELSAGEHELSLWLLEPGVIIQKLVLDVGGLETSALGPPESARV